MPRSDREILESIDERMAALRARKARINARKQHTVRRRHSHCLILIGGSLLAMAEAGDDAEAAACYERVFTHAKGSGEGEAKALDQWCVDRAERARKRRGRTGGSDTGAESGAGVTVAEGADGGRRDPERRTDSDSGASNPPQTFGLFGADGG